VSQVVCDFCEEHLPANKAAFADSRLELVYDDARAQLEAAEPESYDVIIADLADPLEEGPCFQVGLIGAFV
jgi:thermospermine synthase